MTCHFVLLFSVWWWGDEVTMQVLHRQKETFALSLDPTSGTYSAPFEPPAARANVLTHVGLWPTAIKLNPS